MLIVRSFIRFFIVLMFILMIKVVPVKATEYSGWSEEDELCISQEIEVVNSKLGFDVLESVTIYLLSPDSKYISCWSSFVCFGDIGYCDNSKVQGLMIHEIGHKVINDLEYVWEDMEFSLGYYVESEGGEGEYVHVSGMHPEVNKYMRTDSGYIEASQPYCQHCSYMQPEGQSYREDFADMFMGYFMGYFSDDEGGRLREEYMEEFVERNFGEGFGKDGFSEDNGFSDSYLTETRFFIQ